MLYTLLTLVKYFTGQRISIYFPTISKFQIFDNGKCSFLKRKKGFKLFHDPKCCLFQFVNMFISAIKLDILTWRSLGTDSLLEPASSGH